MRLRTLPVSIAGIFSSIGYSIIYGTFQWLPASLCIVFALLAQISSNFANEYYDFKAGLDRSGRVGPRRGVTEGDIAPKDMRTATFMSLSLACIIGCCLLLWGGLWLIPIGILIALGVLAYSTGPYPLSHHGLGEIAVIFFFGLIPVNLTFYILSGFWSASVFCGSISIGLMGANVLIINNYRDIDDDRSVGKRTLAVILGRPAMIILYGMNGILSVLLMLPTWLKFGFPTLVLPLAYISLHISLIYKLRNNNGRALNPLLGKTAMAMLFYCIAFMATSIIARY